MSYTATYARKDLRLGMQLISSRTIPFLDSQSLAPRQAKEALFRSPNGFVLYLSDGAPQPRLKEKVIHLDTREALLWLGEDPDEPGSFWHEADDSQSPI
jgi:hypothetical protein